MSEDLHRALFQSRRGMPPLFVAAAVSAIFASLLGANLVPGMRGNASEHAVELLERASGTLSYALWGLLLLFLANAATTLMQRPRPTWIVRAALLVGAVCVCFASVSASFGRLDEVFAILLSLAAEAAVLVGAAIALRSVATRAAAIILVAFAFASAARLVSWELASSSTERLDPHLYVLSRAAATASVGFELAALVVSLLWLARRRWPLGQMDIVSPSAASPASRAPSLPGAWVAGVAIVAALLVIFASAHGADGSSGIVDVVIHASLDRATTPPAFLFGSASFLAPIALALAAAMFVTVPRTGPVGVCIIFALVARGAYDVPLRALAATCAAYYLALTAGPGSQLAPSLELDPAISTANGETDR